VFQLASARYLASAVTTRNVQNIGNDTTYQVVAGLGYAVVHAIHARHMASSAVLIGTASDTAKALD
jgi:hypothetical protein